MTYKTALIGDGGMQHLESALPCTWPGADKRQAESPSGSSSADGSRPGLMPHRRGDTSSRAGDGWHSREEPATRGTGIPPDRAFQQGARRRGQVSIVGPRGEIGQENGEVLRRRTLQAVAQVGVVHLALDDPKRDARITADDQDLAHRVSWYPMGPAQSVHRLGLLQCQGPDAGHDRGGPPGLVHLAKLILGRDLPAQIISTRSQGTQWVGSPLSPSIRSPSARQRPGGWCGED